MASPGGILGSSLNALTNDLDTTTNNLANMNTAGYKRKVNDFSRVLMRHLTKGSKFPQTGGEILTHDSIDFSQGMLSNTKRKLDIALQGKGFFVLETPNGKRYTRNGSFHLNSATGQLTDIHNNLLSGVNRPIIIPPNTPDTDIHITDDGMVSARGTNLGQIQVVNFDEGDLQKLELVGNSMFKAPDNLREQQANDTIVRQGYQERSNVSIMDETVNMMSVARLYEMNMNIIKRKRENNKTMVGVANS